MPKSGDKLQRLLTVFITWAVLAISFIAYEQYFVHRQEEFLKARGFTALASLSEELTSQVHRAQRLTESYVQLAVLQDNNPKPTAYPLEFLRLYFKDLHQQEVLEQSFSVAKKCMTLKHREVQQSEVVGSDLNNIALSLSCFTRTAPGTADSPDPASKTLLYTLNLSPWIRNAFQPLGGDFDDVLLADSSGRVLFQKSTTTPRIVDLKSLLPHDEDDSKNASSPNTGSSKEGTTGPKVSGSDSSKPAGRKALVEPSLPYLTQTRILTHIDVAGEQYELFMMPSPVPLTGVFPTNKWELVLCAMWRTSNFESESRAIPYSTLIWATLITLALFSLSWPVFKLRYMSNAERFTAAEGWYLILTLFLASTSVTLMLLNASYASRAQEATDENLKKLASQINSSYREEMRVAVTELQHLRPNGQDQPLVPNYLQEWPDSAHTYPYFEIAYWVDSSGEQVQKFDVRPAATPPINVRNLPFFTKTVSDLVSRRGRAAEDDKMSESDRQSQLFESVYVYPQLSITTNEFVAGLSAPFLADAGQDILLAGLTLRPISLVDPILPPGYGFAVVDDECRVLLHSDSFKNVRENFCLESTQPTELQPWLFSGRNAALDISYSGHPGRAFLTSLEPPRFAAGRSFLIVFEESDHQLTPNLAIMLVCAILLGSYFVFLLFVALLHMSLRVPLHEIYVPRLIWPCAENSLAYLQIAVALGAILLLFWISYLRLYEAPLVTLTLVVAALAPLLVILKLKFRAEVLALFGRALIYMSAAVLVVLAGFIFVHSPAFEEWWSTFAVLGMSGIIAVLLSGRVPERLKLTLRFPRMFTSLELFARNHFDVAYSIAALTVIIASFLVPCIGSFKYAYDAVTELSLKHDEIALSERLQARKDRIVEYYQALKMRNPQAAVEKRLAEPWDRYDNCFFAVEHDKNTDDYFSEKIPRACGISRTNKEADVSPETEKINLWIERVIANATLRFPSNRLGSEISKLGVASSEEPLDSWEHSFTELKDTTFRLSWNSGSRLPRMIVLAGYPRWQGMRWWAALCTLLLWTFLGLWVMSLVRKIFFTEVPNTRAFDEVDWKDSKQLASHFLVIGRAKSGKTAWLECIRGLAKSDRLDLRVNLKQITTREALEASSGSSVIVLDHFDFNLKDRECNLAKLEFLEKLLYVGHRRVVVVSTVEPLYFLSEGPPEWLSDGKDPELVHRLLDRWALVLSRLRVVRAPESNDGSFNQKVKEFLRLHRTHRSHRQFAIWVRQECRSTVMLRGVGTSILENFQESDPVTREWIKGSVLDRADDYYHVLWSGLSAGERMVLYQLALDGWANPKNVAALQQLERKSLICRGPMYKLMNRSFGEFVLGAEHADEIKQWEKQQQQSTWRAFKLVLIAFAVGVAAWLLHSQAALSQVVVAYIAGIGTLLTAIAGLLGRSGGKAAPKPEET